MKPVIYLIFILLYGSFSLYAQNALTGTVLDAGNKQPLGGVTIVPADGSGTKTNEDGTFTVACVPNSIITVSHVGYQTKKLTIRNCNLQLLIELSPSLHPLDQVEITASSMQNKSTLYMPQSITKLTHTELKRGTGLFLDDAVNGNVPGVIMQRRAVSSGQQFNLRGYGNGTRGTRGVSSNFDGQGYKIYLNDIPVTDAEGITIMDDIDFGSIGNVEITKGPSGTLYGMAIAGVVALQTIRPEKGETGIQQDALVGSYGLQRYTTHFRMGNENASLLVNYGRQKSDGFMTHTASKKDFMNLIASFHASQRQKITTYFSYTNSYDERGGELTIEQFTNRDYSGNPNYIKQNAHSAVISYRAGLSYFWQFNDAIANTTTVFGSGTNSHSSSAAGWTDRDALNYGLRSSFTTQFSIGRSVSISGLTGIETQRQHAQSMGYKMMKDPSDTTTTWTLGVSPYWIIGSASSNTATLTGTTSLFTEWTISLPKDFSITAGIGWSRMHIELNDRFTAATPERPSRYDTTYTNMVSPHVAINKVFNRQFSVYASYSRAYKAPVSSYFFVTVPAVGSAPASGRVNGVLKPETGNQLEIGTKGALLHDRLTYQVAAFNVIYADKMTAVAVPSPVDPNTTLYAYVVNGGKQNHKGIEALVKVTAYESQQHFVRAIRPYGNITWSDFKYEDFTFQKSVTETEDYSGKAVAGVPKITGNLGVDVETRPGVYATVNYMYKDRMPVTSLGTVYATSYSLINAKMGIRRAIQKHFMLEAFVGADNLAGTQYAWMIFINQLPDAYIAAPDKPVYYGGISLSYKL